jgi:hypothetical protein
MTARAALVRLALVLAAGALVLVVPAPASAAKPCWQKVLDDWNDNGRFDHVYATHCYRDALRHVPEDQRDYTSIVDDISSAMQNATRMHEHQSGAPVGSSGGNGNGGSNGGGGGSSGSGPGSGHGGGAVPSHDSFKKASAKLDSSDANSLPLPLILLGSLALLLLGAAAGVRLYRYLQERRNGLRPAPARRP